MSCTSTQYSHLPKRHCGILSHFEAPVKLQGHEISHIVLRPEENSRAPSIGKGLKLWRMTKSLLIVKRSRSKVHIWDQAVSSTSSAAPSKVAGLRKSLANRVASARKAWEAEEKCRKMQKKTCKKMEKQQTDQLGWGLQTATLAFKASKCWMKAQKWYRKGNARRTHRFEKALSAEAELLGWPLAACAKQSGRIKLTY